MYLRLTQPTDPDYAHKQKSSPSMGEDKGEGENNSRPHLTLLPSREKENLVHSVLLLSLAASASRLTPYIGGRWLCHSVFC